jgi:putative component of membrane protein insertase Oxa1/YidC/SpoIIIJ protein YidD
MVSELDHGWDLTYVSFPVLCLYEKKKLFMDFILLYCLSVLYFLCCRFWIPCLEVWNVLLFRYGRVRGGIFIVLRFRALFVVP